MNKFTVSRGSTKWNNIFYTTSACSPKICLKLGNNALAVASCFPSGQYVTSTEANGFLVHKTTCWIQFEVVLLYTMSATVLAVDMNGCVLGCLRSAWVYCKLMFERSSKTLLFSICSHEATLHKSKLKFGRVTSATVVFSLGLTILAPWLALTGQKTTDTRKYFPQYYK